MKTFIGINIIIASILCGLYVGAWLLFIKPIIDVCIAFDNNTLTGVMVGWTIIKCIFASTVGSLLTYLGITIGIGIMEQGVKRFVPRLSE
jgi:hypothetical protein